MDDVRDDKPAPRRKLPPGLPWRGRGWKVPQGRRWGRRRYTVIAAATAMLLAGSVAYANQGPSTGGHHADWVQPPHAVSAAAYRPVGTTTPIQHVVVIFDENISFDHYFGTYPNAANTDGTPFTAKPGTPKVNGLTPALLNNNPNAYDPKRLTPSQALTCDQNHGYGAEQQAFDNGRMDKFVEYTETETCTGQPILFGQPGIVMDYYDGNTVTALWNYAQNYAMSDNSYGTTFGPSTPGALNLVSGQTYGATPLDPNTGKVATSGVASPNAQGVGTVIGDPDPAYDDCSDKSHTSASPVVSMSGRNIGDDLNARNVTWGWFQGGFTPTSTNAAGYAVCGTAHQNVGGNTVTDYVPHHEPFQYYKSTANPQHLPPSSVAAIGRTDQANHQYDLTAFDQALKAGNMPAVSFLKPAAYQNGHAANSDPLDEQHFIASEINQIQQSPFWSSTAIIVAYDDSDGWYDHQAGPRADGSHDATQDAAYCTSVPWVVAGQQDRCGYGPRLPFLVISPYAKSNYVSHKVTDQSSVTKFIEENWLLPPIGGGSADVRAGSLLGWDGFFDFTGRRAPTVILNPTTGAVVSSTPDGGHGHR